MKIAYVAFRLPYPPTRGDRLHLYHLLLDLCRHHEVTLFCVTDGRDAPDAMRRVTDTGAHGVTVSVPLWRSWMQAIVGLLAPGTPSQVAYFRSAALRRRVEAHVAATQPDVLVSHSIRMIPYVAPLAHPNKVLFAGDSLGQLMRDALPFMPRWRRGFMRWEGRRVDRFTAREGPRFREVWAVSARDAEDFRRLGCPSVRIIRHGIDPTLLSVVRAPVDPPEVLFLGNLSVPHNVDGAVHLAESIWPRVRRSLPAARLILAGADPVPRVRRLARGAGVRVTGTVPNLAALWGSASVFAAPLRFCAGVQNKVLEAMAARVPVVTTPMVAEGLGAVDGEHLLVRSSPDSIAAAILDVIAQPGPASDRSERALAFLRERFNWSALRERLEELEREAAPVR